MIKCGAFDAFGHYRRQLMESIEDVIEKTQKRNKVSKHSQAGLFEFESPFAKVEKSTSAEIKTIPEWNSNELLAYEKEMLGFYITSHPLSAFTAKLKILADTDSASLSERKDGDPVTIAGIVSGIREIIQSKRYDGLCHSGGHEGFCQPPSWLLPISIRKAYPLFHDDAPIMIKKGIVDAGEESSKGQGYGSYFIKGNSRYSF